MIANNVEIATWTIGHNHKCHGGIYNAMIVSQIIYSAETWNIRETDEHRLLMSKMPRVWRIFGGNLDAKGEK